MSRIIYFYTYMYVYYVCISMKRKFKMSLIFSYENFSIVFPIFGVEGLGGGRNDWKYK